MISLPEILQSIRPECDFTRSINYLEDGLLDSFDLIMLVSELDSQFGISVQGIDIVPENFQNIGAIEKLLISYGVQL